MAHHCSVLFFPCRNFCAENFLLRTIALVYLLTYNMFSLCQFPHAANKARQFIIMPRRSFKDLSKSDAIPFHGALVRRHLEHDGLACLSNLVADVIQFERIQKLPTKFITAIRHHPYEERRQPLGHHSLQRWQLRADLIFTFKVFTGPLDVDPNLFFSPSLWRAPLEGTPKWEPSLDRPFR